MMNEYEVTSGSVIGKDHFYVGSGNRVMWTMNNQDAVCVFQCQQITIAMVADGCGSGSHSEVGAQLGVKLLTKAILDNLVYLLNKPNAQTLQYVLDRARQDTLAQISVMAKAMGGSFTETISNYFLFTVLGVLITKDFTAIFGIGDGVYVINGQRFVMERFALSEKKQNSPPYMCYALTGSEVLDKFPQYRHFVVHQFFYTQNLASVMIATDGVEDLIAAVQEKIPGKDELVGDLSQFTDDDKYFLNPSLTQGRLNLINGTVVRAHQQTRVVERESGLLPDDTSLIAIRRKPMKITNTITNTITKNDSMNHAGSEPSSDTKQDEGEEVS